MTRAAAYAIDEYASSMFRFERLHDGWIDRCARYLEHIFGDRIKGRTVIDYAFGRGNWSVAFLRAGAAKVIAIDASASNVERFARYCGEHELTSIDVVCGNVLDEHPPQHRADILWLYGILPAIPDQRAFIKAALTLVPGKEALVLAYGYDKDSVRQWIVDHCRSVVRYEGEEAFRADSLKFTPAARMRARDDLTAPHVHWHSAAAMAQDFAGFGWHPVKQVDDFRVVDASYGMAEFAPVHLLFARTASKPPVTLKETSDRYAGDLKILSALWDALLPRLDARARRDLAISAFNTHFSHLGGQGEVEESLLQLYLLLLYGLRMRGAEPGALGGLAAEAFALGDAAISDRPRRAIAGMEDTFLVRYLLSHTVRI